MQPTDQQNPPPDDDNPNLTVPREFPDIFAPDAQEYSTDNSNHHHGAAARDVQLVSEDIDRFTHALRTAAADDKSNPPHVPDTVETFSKIIESRIVSTYTHSANRAQKMTEEDSFFIEAVVRLSQLTNALSGLPSAALTSDSLNRTSNLLQKAMSFLEEELRALLEDSKVNPNHSFNASPRTTAEPPDHDHSKTDPEDGFPGYSAEMVTKMGRIASAMISAGYEKECFQTYSIARRTHFYEQLKVLEHEKLNMDDVWRMSWETLEGEIKRWINIVKNCSKILFPAEKKLGEKVFTDHPSTFTPIFSNLARSVVIQLLDFAGAVAITKRSGEKLFKFLDMYETLLDLIPAITADKSKGSGDCEHELRSEIIATCDRLGEAATNIFLDLENSIKNDVAKTPVPGGAVHPLTRYVLNYLKYACEYKSALEKIYDRCPKSKLMEQSSDSNASTRTGSNIGSPHTMEDEGGSSVTRFSGQVGTIMDLLDGNIEAKSMLYKDPSLRWIFLMNNGRYVLQKVKGSPEIYQVMGDTRCRKRSTVVRQFHKNYQRETWMRLLQVLNHEGLLVNGKVNKPLLKERFKNFNNMFEEIHKSQNSWVVSDEQLQSELRVSISAVVIPAYRSFLGRFRQYLDSSKQADKYIKYQPEDLESLIEDLFDGNPGSMARRRT